MLARRGLAYAIELEDGRKAVLKVAPPPGLRLLTYEADLMQTEVEFFARAAAAGVPVPRVLYCDLGRTVLESDFLVLEWLEGVPLDKLELGEEELRDVRRQVGALAARLHAVRGASFGYPRPGSATWQPTWRGAFLAMLGDLLADARALASDLPRSPDDIEALVVAYASVLDDVTEPALVHFDLWDTNVFICPVEGRWTVEAVIDGERAFYGDPCAELVSAAQLQELDVAADFLAGYGAERGEPFVLTESVRRRHSLYRIYLLLVICIESATRGFDDDPEHQPIRQRIDHDPAPLDSSGHPTIVGAPPVVGDPSCQAVAPLGRSPVEPRVARSLQEVVQRRRVASVCACTGGHACAGGSRAAPGRAGAARPGGRDRRTREDARPPARARVETPSPRTFLAFLQRPEAVEPPSAYTLRSELLPQAGALLDAYLPTSRR